MASLVYLGAIHRTEYSINARSAGSKVSVASRETLAAMLTSQALFGVPGLVSVPWLYSFFRNEFGRIWRSGQSGEVIAPHPPAGPTVHPDDSRTRGRWRRWRKPTNPDSAGGRRTRRARRTLSECGLVATPNSGCGGTSGGTAPLVRRAPPQDPLRQEQSPTVTATHAKLRCRITSIHATSGRE